MIIKHKNWLLRDILNQNEPLFKTILIDCVSLLLLASEPSIAYDPVITSEP